MSVLTVRGGVPVVRRETITTTGQKLTLPFYTLFLVARNKGANVCRLYFTEDDFDANENFVELDVAAAATPHGEWAGPVETVADNTTGRDNIYLRAVGGSTDVEVVAFQRRS